MLAVAPAMAQGVAVTVNGQPVTTSDVQQRQRIAQVVEGASLSRAQALQTAIDDVLKIQEGRRLGYRVAPAMIAEATSRYAARAGLDSIAFGSALRREGIAPRAFEAKLEADISWDAIIRTKIRPNLNVTNAEIAAAVAESVQRGEARVVEFELQSIVFVVPGGSSAAAQRQMGKARAARRGFSGCDAGFDAMRGQVDVAVKPRFGRSSNEMPGEMLKLLERIPVGGISEPYVTAEGIEMTAVCRKFERDDVTATRDRVDQRISGERLAAGAERYLAELRSRAEIVRR